jgi:hypothetical protein
LENQLSFKQKLARFWNRLKDRYDISSDWHAIFVLFIFAIAGSTIIFIKKPIFDFLGYHHIENTTLKVIAYVLIILPVYYASLFLWSNLLGQGKIFNPLIKKMLMGYTRLFKRKKK